MVRVEFGTSSAFRGWVKVRVLGYGFCPSLRGRKVKSGDHLSRKPHFKFLYFGSRRF